MLKTSSRHAAAAANPTNHNRKKTLIAIAQAMRCSQPEIKGTANGVSCHVGDFLCFERRYRPISRYVEPLMHYLSSLHIDLFVSTSDYRSEGCTVIGLSRP